VYVDGVSRATGTYTGLSFLNSSADIGNDGDTGGARNEAFVGTLDEVRVSSIARGVGWIKTCHNSQNAPASFYSVDTEETESMAAKTLTQWQTAYPAFDQDSQDNDPLYVNTTAGSEDLHLQATSPCIDAAVDILGITDGYDHGVRATDIGGDEEGAFLAVTLAGFSVEPAAGGVRVRWETSLETDHACFDLWRQEVRPAGDGHDRFLAAGRWTRVNARPIRLAAGSDALGIGARYELLDATAAPGRHYWYRLEDVSCRGKRTLHPVSGAVAAGRPLPKRAAAALRAE